MSTYGGNATTKPTAAAPVPRSEPKMTKSEMPPPEVQKIFDTPPNVTTPISFLGSGSYAKVWKVKHREKIRAVKVIDIRHATATYKNKFMHREIEIIKGVSLSSG